MNSRLRPYLFLIFIICFKYSLKCSCANQYTSDINCRTPDGMDAKCINVHQCQTMLDILKNLKPPYPQEVSRKLRMYKCNGDLKVCCPKEPIVLDSSELYQKPPDVTNHKNVHFLPENCGHTVKIIRYRIIISGGTDAEINEFPWMALLQYKTSKGLEFLCGGTIINSKYILTAAHCLELEDKELVSVRVGEYNIKNSSDCQTQSYFKRKLFCNPPVQNLEVEEVIPHPQFQRKPKIFINDIALLRVSKIIFAEHISPVCLPVGKFRDITYVKTTVTGWGLTDSQSVVRADILQKVELPVIDKINCLRIYGQNNINISHTQICIGGQGEKASCPGDSGGPMMVGFFEDSEPVYVQYGIISFGPRYCEIPLPNVNTEVKYYMDWILDNMKS